MPSHEPAPAVETDSLRLPDRVEHHKGRFVWAFERRSGREPVQVPSDLLDRFLTLRWPAFPPGVPAATRTLFEKVEKSTRRRGAPRLPASVASRYAALDEDRVFDFASSYGVFGLCRHGLPTTHAWLAEPPVEAVRQAFPQVTACLPLGAMDESLQRRMGLNPVSGGLSGLAGWEPISYWRTTASMLYSVLAFADALNLEESPPHEVYSDLFNWPSPVLPGDPAAALDLLGLPRVAPEYGPPSLRREWRRWGAWPDMISPKEDWDLATWEHLYRDRYAREPSEPETVFGANLGPPLDTLPIPIGRARLWFDRYVDGLLQIARPHLVFRSAHQRPALLATDGLFGALVLKLLLQLNDSTGFAVCSACGDLYTPRRRPSPEQNAYCPRCRTATANAARQRRFREKIRARATSKERV
jgi:hypothetical protein